MTPSRKTPKSFFPPLGRIHAAAPTALQTMRVIQCESILAEVAILFSAHGLQRQVWDQLLDKAAEIRFEAQLGGVSAQKHSPDTVKIALASFAALIVHVAQADGLPVFQVPASSFERDTYRA